MYPVTGGEGEGGGEGCEVSVGMTPLVREISTKTD